MSHIDFAPCKVELEPQMGEDRTWWVLLMVNTNHPTHTKIETTNDPYSIWGRETSIAGKTWRAGVYVDVGDETVATVLKEEFSESTLRGQLSRAAVLEKLAGHLNYEVYNDIEPLLQLENAENLIKRESVDNLPKHKQRKKK